MRLRKETKQEQAKKLALIVKGFPKELVTCLMDTKRIIALDYKTWFEIPKVRIKAKWLKSTPHPDLQIITTKYYINGKRIRGWSEWNSKVLATSLKYPAPRSGSLLEYAFTHKLTQVINSLVPNASRDKNLAKKVIENQFGVKVKVY